MRVAAWDRFGLSPGSSLVLGTDAHEAHLAWAVTKARIVAPSVTRPQAAVIARDAERNALIAAVEGCGYRVVPGDVAPIVVVDAGAPSAQAAIATGPANRRIIVVGLSLIHI